MLLNEEQLIRREDSWLTREDAETFRSTGSWRGVDLAQYLRSASESFPDRLATVGYDSETGERTAWTYREYGDRAGRLAAGLSEVGVAPGDGVAVMLPNRVEFGATIFAIASLGAVYTGIPVSYGSREVEFILNHTSAKVLVVARSFRGRDLLTFANSLRETCPNLELIAVVGAGQEASLEEPFVTWESLLAAQPHTGAVDPAAVCHIGFTSGTTGEPKGVMNTHQTLDVVLRNWVEFVGAASLGDPVVNLLPSPVGHHSGFLWGVLMTAYLGGTTVLMDRWSASSAGDIVAAEKVTAMIAAPTFLQDLIDLPELGPERTESWRFIAIPGAPIPRALVARARDALGCFICPAWGMTEWGIGVSGAPHLATDRLDETDGMVVPGCELRVVDDELRPTDPGVEGDLQIRGPGLFVGYFDRPEFTSAAVEDGWFRTGDRAVMDATGFVEIRGRTKDIIIRGGENIPVIEIENVIYRHPAVEEVALVGLPDERLGERACAFVVVRGGGALDLPALSEHLLAHGVSKHFLPERLEIIDEMPKTMSGKIRKIELRDRASASPSG